MYRPTVFVSIFTSSDFRYLRTRLKFVLIDSVKPPRGPFTAMPVGGSEMERSANFFRSTESAVVLPSKKRSVLPSKMSFVHSGIVLHVLVLAAVIAFASVFVRSDPFCFDSGARTSKPSDCLSVTESTYTATAGVFPTVKSKKTTSSLPSTAFTAFTV